MCNLVLNWLDTPFMWQHMLALIAADAAEMRATLHHSIAYGTSAAFTTHEYESFRVYHVYMWLEPVHQTYICGRFNDWLLLPEPRPIYHIRDPLYLGYHFAWQYASILEIVVGAEARALKWCIRTYGETFILNIPERLAIQNYHFRAWLEPVHQSYARLRYWDWQSLPEPRPAYSSRIPPIPTDIMWYYYSLDLIVNGVEFEILDWSREAYGYDTFLSTKKSNVIWRYHFWAWVDPINHAHVCHRYWNFQSLPEPRTPYVSHLAGPWCQNRCLSLLSVWVSDYHDYCNLACVQAEYAIVFGHDIDNRDIYDSTKMTALETIYRDIRWVEKYPNPPRMVCLDLGLQLRCNDESIDIRALRIRFDMNNPSAGILEYKLQPDEGRKGFHPTMS